MSIEANDYPDALAIVGMSGRFPSAPNVDALWERLREGTECISFFSPAEMEDAGVDPTFIRHPSFVNAGGFLDGVDMFDAGFFGFSPREAEIHDPQHRLFLECSWEALEHAGYDPQKYNGSIGVFGGAALSSYLFGIMSNPELMALVGSYQILLGNDKDHLATQVSYKLNLTGPSVTVQTACSTSLVAVCFACQSLLDHQCDTAIAGAAAIKVPQKTGYLYQEGMINSPDGHCRVFDSDARGTVGGNGVGVVVLKRLADAIEDGDTVHAVIRGFAINNDGSSKVGYTAPSVEGQAQVIAMAQAMAGVDPDTITYVEAHGTGTPLGDPIEIAALMQAFRAGTNRKNFCGLGSVKSNIGHLDPAAGVAGLIKTCLMLRHKQLPPSLHFKRPNPQIDFANSPFYVVRQLADWPANGIPRRAGVSSFGIGGTNAHVVLEEPAEAVSVSPLRREQLLVLSARTATALDATTANLASHLQSTAGESLADVAYTCQIGRRAFPFRRFAVAKDTDDAIAALSSPERGRALTGHAGAPRPVVFLFPGQGSQYADMTRGLYETEPTYRREIDRCSELLKPRIGLDLRAVLFPAPDQSADAARRIEQTALAQPALFVVEYALAKLWMEWGVRPQALAGHSIGEYVAACLGGVFSLEDALSLVAMRGKLMQQVPAGSMLAVPLSEPAVQPLLGPDLNLAAVNTPSLCVVSGPVDTIARLQDQLRAQNVESRRLHTSHAFHSHMMDAVVPSLAELARGIRLNPPQIRCLSNTSGTWLTAADATDPTYWSRHLRQTVRFVDNVEHLVRQPEWVLLEVGPGDTLGNLARQHPSRQSAQVVVSSVRHPNSRETDGAVILNALGKLWLAGAEVDWTGFHTHRRHRRVPLPTYPFERQRYWIEPRRPGKAPSSRLEPANENTDIGNWFYRPVWNRSTALATIPPGREHEPWLIFADPHGFGIRIAERLRTQGHETVTVSPGASFTRSSASDYVPDFVIDPRQPEHYKLLVRELAASSRMPRTVVHCWSVTADAPPPSDESFDATQRLGLFSIISITQALGEQRSLEPISLAIIGSHLHAIAAGDGIDPGKATVLAAAKVIPQEHPHMRCRTIDVSGDLSTDETAAAILGELTAGTDTVVGYRYCQRWVQSFEPVRLQPGSAGVKLIRDHGVYLITGGVGKIGLTLAEYIARAARAKLILLTRSDFPPAEQWPAWLRTHGDSDRVSRAIRKLQSIEQLGARVMVLTADVADTAQLTRALEEARNRFGRVNGVVHAAGETSQDAFCEITSATPEACERQFRPKVRGLLSLEKALAGDDIDFHVLFSSLSAVLGGIRFAPYAAANLFLDAYANRQSHGDGGKWISVNWDGWDYSDGAAQPGTAIPPQAGANAFGLLLSQAQLPQVVVSVSDLGARLAQWIDLLSPGASQPASAAAAGSHARPNLNSVYVAPRDPMERSIAAVWQEMLGLEQVGIHDNFFELGGHSLLAVQVVSRLRASLQTDIAVNALFETPTVAQLAEGLRNREAIAGGEEANVAELLDMVESMSDSEIKAMLAKHGKY